MWLKDFEGDLIKIKAKDVYCVNRSKEMARHFVVYFNTEDGDDNWRTLKKSQLSFFWFKYYFEMAVLNEPHMWPLFFIVAFMSSLATWGIVILPGF